MIIGSELYIGAAEVNITPKLAVALMGQFHLRIAHEIHGITLVCFYMKFRKLMLWLELLTAPV